MAAYSWPSLLPSGVSKNISADFGLLVSRTPMDKGVPKMRKLGKRANRLDLTFYMTKAQIDVLNDFIVNTVAGVKRFNFTHPILLTVVEVRFVPEQDGTFYKLTYFKPSEFIVNLSLEVMP